MKVLICWSHISGYMAACWRALQARGVELSIVAFRTDVQGSGTQAAFSENVMAGLNARLLAPSEQYNGELIWDHAKLANADVIVVPGWFHPPYRALVFSPKFAHVKFVMTMDTPWRNQLRQKLARLRLRAYVNRMSAVVVAGERAWQYARQLGVPEQKILRGVYGFDASPLLAVAERRMASDWPRRFLYVGRYVDDKAIDILLAGYSRYRKMSKNPWPLVCCGQGPWKDRIDATQGVEDLGFRQPAELPQILAEHGAFVLVSRYEPWGVVIAEALYSGLPVICSEACGASVELVRHHANGLLVPTEDPDALASAMLWMDQHSDELPAMGDAGRAMAKAYAAEFWARRWHAMLQQITA